MVNYGIIGCGMMGHEHLNNIKLLDGTNISVIFKKKNGFGGMFVFTHNITNNKVLLFVNLKNVA